MNVSNDGINLKPLIKYLSKLLLQGKIDLDDVWI